MATILSVSGSPSATSRTARLLRHLDARLTAQGHEVIALDVRTLPAEALLEQGTGGTTAHVLAIDYALRPVLASMGPAHITPGWFTLDKDITVADDGTLTVAPGSAEALAQVADQFSAALGGRTTLLAATG